MCSWELVPGLRKPSRWTCSPCPTLGDSLITFYIQMDETLQPSDVSQPWAINPSRACEQCSHLLLLILPVSERWAGSRLPAYKLSCWRARPQAVFQFQQLAANTFTHSQIPGRGSGETEVHRGQHMAGLSPWEAVVPQGACRVGLGLGQQAPARSFSFGGKVSVHV